MKSAWQLLASYGATAIQRFDSRAERERIWLLSACLVVAFWLADKVCITPAFQRSKAAAMRLSTASSDLQRLRADAVAASASGLARERELHEELSRGRSLAQAESGALRDEQSALVGADHMVDLLQAMLPHDGRLKVLALKSLGATDVSAPGSGLYRHGVELTVEGGWNDLLAYLAALEAMPTRLLWGGMSLRADRYPTVVLTLRLYTLSVDRTWLEI